MIFRIVCLLVSSACFVSCHSGDVSVESRGAVITSNQAQYISVDSEGGGLRKGLLQEYSEVSDAEMLLTPVESGEKARRGHHEASPGGSQWL